MGFLGCGGDSLERLEPNRGPLTHIKRNDVYVR